MSMDIVQFLIYLVILFLLARPFGSYMAKVYLGERVFLTPVLSPVEKGIYRFCRVNGEEMGWREYASSMLLFNGVLFLSLFMILLLQGMLPLNPQKIPGASWTMALNTAISFVTNTNWQSYAGETEVSFFTQIVGLTVHNFLSAATGMVVVVTLIRGFSRKNTHEIGNFWIDLTRTILYILLPLAMISAIFLVSQGVIQNFSPYKTISLMEGGYIHQEKAKEAMQQSEMGRVQTIPMGPVASQEAIKQLGTNGGGFFNANSAHPFENPTPLSDFLERLLMLLIPAGLPFAFGHMVGNPRQGRTLFAAMLILLAVAAGCMYGAEIAGNPLVTKMGVAGRYLEGKEVRFGVGGSSLFAVLTTATSCGAVNALHDSFTPLGGMTAMIMMLLGEVVLGGVGSGLYTMLAFVVIAVFVAGLMIGRTPEYLGKKIEVQEMWMSVVTVLTAGMVVLVFTAVALLLPAGVEAMANPGAHGLSEVLYAFASTANNNGSAFAGLNAATTFYRLMTSVAIFLGRYVPAVAVLAMAGNLAAKRYSPPGLGTLPTDTPTFTLWLMMVIVLIGALTFFPALALGPVVEYLAMSGGN
jgi:potassium-transporting ATPase potassium-binding subunit